MKNFPPNSFSYQYYSGDDNIYKKILSLKKEDDLYTELDTIIDDRRSDIDKLQKLNHEIYVKAQYLLMDLEKRSKEKFI